MNHKIRRFDYLFETDGYHTNQIIFLEIMRLRGDKLQVQNKRNTRQMTVTRRYNTSRKKERWQ